MDEGDSPLFVAARVRCDFLRGAETVATHIAAVAAGRVDERKRWGTDHTAVMSFLVALGATSLMDHVYKPLETFTKMPPLGLEH